MRNCAEVAGGLKNMDPRALNPTTTPEELLGSPLAPFLDLAADNPEVANALDVNTIDPRLLGDMTNNVAPENAYSLDDVPQNELDVVQQGDGTWNGLFQTGSFPDDLRAIQEIERILDIYTQNRVHEHPPLLEVPRDYRQSSKNQNVHRHFMGVKGLVDWIEDPWGDLEAVGAGSISRERGRIRGNGFRPTEVMASGALNCFPLRTNDLSYAVHRIFRFENFINCERKVYEELTPALRLASIWLTHPSCRSFFLTILFGKRYIDAEETLKRKSLTTRVDRFEVAPNDQLEIVFDRYMGHMADHSSFEFDKTIWPDCEDVDKAYGCAETFNSFPGIFLGDDVRPWSESAKFHIMHDFYTMAHKFAAMKYPDEAARLRFYFFFAVNIVHEVAHGIETRSRAVHFLQLRRNLGLQGLYSFFVTLHGYLGTDNACDISHEALYEDNSVSETGEAWEKDFFGGRLLCINAEAGGSDGLFFVPVAEENVHPGTKLYSVPMGYMEEMQQQSFWNHFEGQRCPKDYFRVPEIGAVAFNVANFSTFSFRAWIEHREEQENGYVDIDMVDTPSEPYPEKVQSRFKPGTLSLITNTASLRTSEPLEIRRLSSFPRQPQVSDTDVEPGQKYLFELNIIPASPSSDAEGEEVIDVALKDPETFSLADKWILAEEYYCRANLCRSLKFLELRAYNELDLDVMFDPEIIFSWSQVEVDSLLELRRYQEEEAGGFDYRRHEDPEKDDEGQYPYKYVEAKKWQYYEELAVYNGHSRLEIYKQRAKCGINFINEDINFYPPYHQSWGPDQMALLEEKRAEYRATNSKWALFEEYTRLKYRMPKFDFLYFKHNSLFNFAGQPILNLNPDHPDSWHPTTPEMQSLTRLRNETTPERIAAKESCARIAYFLRGLGDHDVFERTRRTGRLRNLVLEPFGCIDPDWAETWNEEATMALDRELATSLGIDNADFEWPVGLDLPNLRLPNDDDGSGNSATATATAIDKREEETHHHHHHHNNNRKITEFFHRRVQDEEGRAKEKEEEEGGNSDDRDGYWESDGAADGDDGEVSEISSTVPVSGGCTPESEAESESES